jgi:hypothetical protein
MSYLASSLILLCLALRNFPYSLASIFKSIFEITS